MIWTTLFWTCWHYSVDIWNTRLISTLRTTTSSCISTTVSQVATNLPFAGCEMPTATLTASTSRNLIKYSLPVLVLCFCLFLGTRKTWKLCTLFTLRLSSSSWWACLDLLLGDLFCAKWLHSRVHRVYFLLLQCEIRSKSCLYQLSARACLLYSTGSTKYSATS